MINLAKIRGTIIEKFGTNSEYAKQTGYSQSELSKILNGNRKIDLKFADTFIHECNITTEEANANFIAK